MPRLGLSISKSFDQRSRTPKPDSYGRRVRHVPGVHVVGERETPAAFSSTFIKVTLTLTVLAAGAMSIALWRLLSFPH